MRKLKALAIAALIVLPVLAFAQWTVKLDRHTDTGTLDPLPRTFGTRATATDIFDFDLDLQAPPTMITFGWYFSIIDPLITELRQDLRPIPAPGETTTWTMIGVWPSEARLDPETLFWNIDSIPALAGQFLIGADLSSMDNMLTISNIILNPGTGLRRDTVFIRFIAATEVVDLTPPYSTNWYPLCGATVDPDTLTHVSVDIIDEESGVNPTTLSVRVNGTTVTPFVTVTPIEHGIHLSAPIASLPAGATIPVNISIADSVGNVADIACSFTTVPEGCDNFITGHVYDLAINPVVGANIVDHSLTYFGTSNPDGSYSIPNVCDGTYILSCVADGYSVEVETVAIAGASIVVDFILEPVASYFSVIGMVRNSITTDAIPSANISAAWAGGSVAAVSGTTGSYVLTNVAGGTYVMFIAQKTGFVSDTIFATIGSDTTINFNLDPFTYNVGGWFYLEDATDHSATEVELVGFGTTTTDADGGFIFTDVPVGTYTLNASPDSPCWNEYTTSVNVIDSDVEVEYTLPFTCDGLPVARNVTATYEDFAGFIYVSWDEPLESGLEEITYDDGSLSNSFFPLPTTQVDRIGTLYTIDGPARLVRIDIQINGEDEQTCDIYNWEGTRTGALLGHALSSEHDDEMFFSFDFADDDIDLDGEIFVQLTAPWGMDTIRPMVDLIGTDEHDLDTWLYFVAYDTFINLIDVAPPGSDFSGYIWVIRVYVEAGDGGLYRVERDARGAVRTTLVGLPELKLQKTYSNVENALRDEPLYRTTETEELTNYRLYRATYAFTDTAATDVELVHTTTDATTRYFIDTECEPETDYYYGVVAMYDEGDSPLSALGLGRRIDYRPAADILVLDWEVTDSLGGSGTIDETQLLLDKFDELVSGSATYDIYVSDEFELLEHFMLINYDNIFVVSGQYPNIRPFFLPTDKTMLAEFLADNNRFLAIGNDFIWQVTEGDTMTTFVRNLGVRFEADGNETLNVVNLTVGNPDFFGGATFTVDYEAGEIADAYVDELSTTNGGIAVMVSQATDPAPEVSATRMIAKTGPNYRSFVSSVYLGAITDSPDRDAIYRAIFDHLEFPVGIAEKPSTPTKHTTFTATPNPFNAATQINFDLPTNDKIGIEVFDNSGRLVKIVAAGAMNAGAHSITWNGTDNTGKTVASGTYSIRLTTSGGSVTRSVTFVK